MRLMTGTAALSGDDAVVDGEIAWFEPASDEAVREIVDADDRLSEGFTRSEWLWIRLANGDLILGVYPQDEAYFAFEEAYP